MPDTPEEIREALLDMLGAVEIDDRIRLAVEGWGEPARDLLREVVRGDVEADAYQRANALYLLGNGDDPEAGDEIARAFDQQELPALRLAAIDALRAAGGPAARKALLTTLVARDGDISERLHAANGLADIGEPDDLPSLEELELTPGELALAQRVERAVGAIRHRAGAPDAQDSDVDQPDDPDDPNNPDDPDDPDEPN